MGCSLCDIVLLIVAIFIPPLAVALKMGCCDAVACLHLIVNIILCFFFYIPAIIHACVMIIITDETKILVYLN